MKKSKCGILFGRTAILLTLALFGGCDRACTLSEVEARERSTRLYTNAMDDYRAGRLEAAIKGFGRVVLDEPKSYSAHFQLATLLQDVRKDYIGAIAHYRAYLALRPSSDKATVATDRMKLCETLMASEIVKKAAVGPESLKKEIAKLTAEREELAAKLGKAEAELAEAQRTITGLKKDNESQHRLIAKLSADDAGAAPATAKEALAELRKLEAERVRRSTKPTDAELLDDDADNAASPTVASQAGEIAKYRAEGEAEEKKDAKSRYAQPVTAGKGSPPAPALFGSHKRSHAAKSGRPETYVVQDGDTLFAISTRFYGNNTKWRAIRELNKATVPPDGRLRVGQTLRLPQ